MAGTGEGAPVFLGTAAKIAVDATTDGKHVRLHLEFRESPHARPIEFVLSARTSMVLMTTFQELRDKHGWQVPQTGSGTAQ